MLQNVNAAKPRLLTFSVIFTFVINCNSMKILRIFFLLIKEIISGLTICSLTFNLKVLLYLLLKL